LEEAGDLHRFLRDLDHFGAWLTKTQKEIASEDVPASLQEAEKLLQQHSAIQDEIDNYAEDYDRTMAYGEKLTAVSLFFSVSVSFYRESPSRSIFFVRSLSSLGEPCIKSEQNRVYKSKLFFYNFRFFHFSTGYVLMIAIPSRKS
jgi:hypothetical protein